MKKKLKIKWLFMIPAILVMLTGSIILTTGDESRTEFLPTLRINGLKDISLQVNDEYTDLGATADFKGKNLTNKIKTKTNLDSTKVGSYWIKYTVNYKGKSVKETREINVVDETAPTITLNGTNEVTIYQNNAYTEAGAVVIDNYDGDISANIQIEGTVDVATLGDYTLTYKASDSSGNEANCTRVVHVVEKKISTTSYVAGSGNSVPVLMYHFFYDDTKGETGNDNNWMAVTDFEAQMKYLSDNNFYFPSWEELEDFIDGKISLPSNSVVVTIDDGDRTFIDLAIPIIEKYNVKATSFAVGAWTAGEVANNYKSSHLFVESHSYDAHKAGRNGKGLLVNMTYDQVVDDTNKIANIVGSKMAYCYPFGHYNDTVIQAISDVGYHMAFTTAGGYVKPGMNKMKLPRVRMSRGISLSSFAAKVA